MTNTLLLEWMLNAGRLQASNARFGASKEEVNEVGLPVFQKFARARN